MYDIHDTEIHRYMLLKQLYNKGLENTDIIRYNILPELKESVVRCVCNICRYDTNIRLTRNTKPVLSITLDTYVYDKRWFVRKIDNGQLNNVLKKYNKVFKEEYGNNYKLKYVIIQPCSRVCDKCITNRRCRKKVMGNAYKTIFF